MARPFSSLNITPVSIARRIQPSALSWRVEDECRRIENGHLPSWQKLFLFIFFQFRSRKTKINCRGDSLCWRRNTLYPQRLALISLTRGSCFVGIILLRTTATDVFFLFFQYFQANSGIFTRLGYDCFFQILTNLSFTNHPRIPRHVISDTKLNNPTSKNSSMEVWNHGAVMA
jgi:hypothetical protein